MASKKINCWEFMKCGREPGGKKTKELGTCPASTDTVFHGTNLGINSGRACWLVAGTFGNGGCSCARRLKSCMECDFYKQVHDMEGETRLTMGSTDIVALTHKGYVRKTNQDRYFIKKLDDGSLMIAVADGMGGEAAGDYAAEITAGRLGAISRIARGKEQEELSGLAVRTDLAIAEMADKDHKLEGMGTTLICVLLRDGIAHWVHAGDSRLYLHRSTKLVQLTLDQTMGQFLVDEGEITEEELISHKARHFLEQCIGCGHCEPETGCREIRPGDMLLLSTDGLHGKVTAKEITSAINNRDTLASCAKALIQAALDAGGDDNITLVMAEAAKTEQKSDE